VQKLDQSQRDLSQTVSDKIEVSKAEIQESVTQLSSAKDAQFDDIISELKSSLEELQSGMRTGCEYSITQIKLLGDTIQDVLDRATDSSSRLHRIMDQEREGLRSELSRMCERIEEMQSAISKKSQQDPIELQLSTLDLKDTVISASETVIESHNKLVREVAQGLEARITNNFTSALEQFGKETRRKRIRYTDGFHKTEHKVASDTESGRLLAARNGNASATKVFSEGCLAKM
jgi:hypothetical protein